MAAKLPVVGNRWLESEANRLGRYFEVGVYGRSVFLVGIEDVLRNRQGFRVRWLGDSLDEALWEIRMLSPHAILFESGKVSQTVLTAILREYPAVKMLELAPERDSVTVISSREQAVASGEELAQMILRMVDPYGG